jgi:hypothetical protein
MQAGAHEGDILDGLYAGEKSDNESHQSVKWSPERVMIGKRSFPYSGTVPSKFLVLLWLSHYSPVRLSFGAPILACFHRQDADKCPVRLSGRHGGGSVK